MKGYYFHLVYLYSFTFWCKGNWRKDKNENNKRMIKDMNENLSLSDSRLQQKLILMKLHWYQMEDISTLAIDEVFANW